MSSERFNSIVSDVTLAVRHRKLPSELEFATLIEETERELSMCVNSASVPKEIVRGLLDVVSMILLHAPDNENEQRLIEMYVDLDELLMRLIP